MDALQKIAYGVGIMIAVSSFIMVMYSFIPHTINDDQWADVNRKYIDVDFIKSQMESHKTFKFFMERYPDAVAQFDKNRGGGATYEVAIANFTSNTSLTLRMDYNAYDDRINVSVRCDKFDSDIRDSSVHGVLSVQFINENTCMEKGLTGPEIKVGAIPFDEDFITLD